MNHPRETGPTSLMLAFPHQSHSSERPRPVMQRSRDPHSFSHLKKAQKKSHGLPKIRLQKSTFWFDHRHAKFTVLPVPKLPKAEITSIHALQTSLLLLNSKIHEKRSSYKAVEIPEIWNSSGNLTD